MKFSRCLILVAALATMSCKSESKSNEAPRKVKCESAVLVNQSGESSSFAGKVVATEDVNLGFRVAGIIDQITVADGASVRKGAIVARLDSRDYKLQLSATQAEYDAIKAEVDRVVELYADQSVSANDYDKATNGLRAITAKLNAHRNALADCHLRAPMDGYVVKSNFSKGEAVAAGTPVVSMISSSAPQITIDIPAKNFLKQDNFESATATFELLGDAIFNLKLQGVSPKGNLNQLYRTTFEVEPTEDGTLPAIGMSAMVNVNYKTTASNIVKVPFSAVVENNGVSSVWVVEEGKVASRTVKIGEVKSEGYALISEGLSDGESVVVAGVNSLKEGQKVSILAKPAQSNIGGIK